ncbi:MAG: hypothetical protein HY735_03220 [Verrucomicrobia bacterium]|nr:hypothetical protein [Verrucomicrobiota bacterium]
MNTRILSSLCLGALCCCAAVAQDKPQPLVQVKIRSFDALNANAKQVGSALGLSSDWDPGSQLARAIGSPDLAGVDRKRPWQFALAVPALGAPPLMALYVPVTDFEAFKKGLQESSLLGGRDNPNELFQSGEFGVVVFRLGQGGDLSAEDKQKVTAWASALDAGKNLIALAVQLDEATRQQALQGLGIGRMAVTQGLARQKRPEGVPFNPEAMAQLMGLYLDGIETVVKGLQRLEVQADLADQTFAISKTVQPLPDSELARWLKADGGGLANLANHLDAKAMFSMAGALGEKPAFMPLIKKLFRLSFQMQNQEVDEKLAGQIDRMMDTLAPMRFVGSGEFGKTFAFSGIYEFPKAGVKEAYATFKQFFTDAMPSLTGPNKAYSSSEFKEGFRKVGDISVDRFSMTMNLDAPMFKMPGQRETLERLWGGGKIEVEYAIKENRLYLANPDKMAASLESAQKPPPAAGLGATANTVFLGRANVLALIKQMATINPAIPASVREKFDRLNTESGDLRFRVDVDGRLSGRAEFPLKLLEAFRQFRSE